MKTKATKLQALTNMAKRLVALADGDTVELTAMHELLGNLAKLGLAVKTPELPLPSVEK